MREVTIKIDDEVYAILERNAHDSGVEVADVVGQLLAVVIAQAQDIGKRMMDKAKTAPKA